MKKLLLITLGAIVVAFGGIAAFAAMQPPEFRVERSIDTEAPTATVFAIVSDLNRFQEWSPWEKLDPAMKKTLEGAPGSVGSSYAWEGNDNVGAGRMTITDIKPGQEVTVKLEFLRPFPTTNVTQWSVAAKDAGSRVTWAMSGRNDGLMAKAFSMLAMESMVGKDFENGLAALKATAERTADESTEP